MNNARFKSVVMPRAPPQVWGCVPAEASRQPKQAVCGRSEVWDIHFFFSTPRAKGKKQGQGNFECFSPISPSLPVASSATRLAWASESSSDEQCPEDSRQKLKIAVFTNVFHWNNGFAHPWSTVCLLVLQDFDNSPFKAGKSFLTIFCLLLAHTGRPPVSGPHVFGCLRKGCMTPKSSFPIHRLSVTRSWVGMIKSSAHKKIILAGILLDLFVLLTLVHRPLDQRACGFQSAELLRVPQQVAVTMKDRQKLSCGCEGQIVSGTFLEQIDKTVA